MVGDATAPARVIPILGGRMAHLCGPGNRVPHLFGSVASSTFPITALNYLPFGPGGQMVNSCTAPVDRCATPGLFHLSTTAIEYQRLTADGVMPLPDNAISDTNAAGGLAFTRRTEIKIMVVANAGVDERRFYMDANQSIALNAEQVCVNWYAPSNFLDVRAFSDAQRDTTTRSGFVLDSFLGVALERIEAPPGELASVEFTQHVVAPGGETTTVAVEIPPYARDVTIYQTLAGVASTVWTLQAGIPGVAALEVGAIPFLPGQRKTQPAIDVGDATHLLSDADPSARAYTLVWTIRP